MVPPSSRLTTAACTEPRLSIGAAQGPGQQSGDHERDHDDQRQPHREPAAGCAARDGLRHDGLVCDERLARVRPCVGRSRSRRSHRTRSAGAGPQRLRRRPRARAPPTPTGTGHRDGPPRRPGSADGHQAQSPAIVVIAGTRIERTRNVSMSTPIATATPTWNRIVSGAVGHRAEGAREDQARGRDDGAGVPGRDPDRVLHAAGLRLLADAVHQEDVVVRPERHEEHEHDQRQVRADAAVPEDLLEQEARTGRSSSRTRRARSRRGRAAPRPRGAGASARSGCPGP